MTDVLMPSGNMATFFDMALYMMRTTIGVGEPVDGALGFQIAASTFAPGIDRFHTILLIIITMICLLVTALLAIVMIRFNAANNPKPARFSHNSLIEVIWTAGPVLILLVIAIPSFPLLYQLDTKPSQTTDASGNTVPLNPEDWLVIKTYGRQWYWSYMYPDNSDEPVEFDSFMIPDEELEPGQKRNLSVDYPMVVPAGTYVNLLIAASDVIHAWAMPSFRLKTDAIPGRLNELWFRVDEPGVYYGQCSELCGIRHAYMPIEVRVIPPSQYRQWHQLAKSDIDEANRYLNSIQPLAAESLPTYAANTIN